MISLDDFDDCIEGVVSRYGQDDILCYSKQKILIKLTQQDMSLSEAYEYFILIL